MQLSSLVQHHIPYRSVIGTQTATKWPCFSYELRLHVAALCLQFGLMLGFERENKSLLNYPFEEDDQRMEMEQWVICGFDN